jgi:hypothetical protein
VSGMRRDSDRLDVATDVALWSAAMLVSLLPGSNRKWWLGVAVPELTRRGVLVKRGKRWVGSRTAIVAALLEEPS